MRLSPLSLSCCIASQEPGQGVRASTPLPRSVESRCFLQRGVLLLSAFPLAFLLASHLRRYALKRTIRASVGAMSVHIARSP